MKKIFATLAAIVFSTSAFAVDLSSLSGSVGVTGNYGLYGGDGKEENTDSSGALERTTKKDGENNFLKKCKTYGVDGCIVVDLPYPENKKFAAKCKKKSINFVQLISPTTPFDRMKKIIKESHDMVYYISMLSTTGGKLKVSTKNILKNYFKIKRINPKKNIVIGFGITDKTISALKSANGLVVGSMLCKSITNSLKMRQNPVTKLDKIVYNLKQKIL